MKCTNCGSELVEPNGYPIHADSGMELCHTDDHLVYEERQDPHPDDPDVIVTTMVPVAVERTKAQPPPSTG